MGDQSGTGKPSIPSWQLPQQSSERTTQETPAATTDTTQDPKDREEILSQASQFLQDESIRHAPIDRKIAFLESKGLSNDEIQKLLGVSRNPETSDSKARDTEPSRPQEAPKDAEVSKQPPSSQPKFSQSSSTTPPTRQNGRSDVPPVITYPEFLYQAQKPPPLVSLQSVLYTLYAASGVAASIYGASEFLVKPMVASLSGARHEFAENAEANLRALNEKIEQNVSVIPEVKRVSQRAGKSLSDEDAEGKDGSDDSESVTSDPTELFHRDIATQTTPDLENKLWSSEAATPAADGTGISDAEKAVNRHLTRLQKISSELNEVQTVESGIDAAYSSARDRVSELQTYLDSMAYSSPTYLSSNLYNFPNADESKDSWKGGMTAGEEDAISTFKSEIRSVKGTLLSAKNFPSGSPASRMRG